MSTETTILAAIARVAPFMDINGGALVLNGVQLKRLDDHRLRVAATDGKALAVAYTWDHGAESLPIGFDAIIRGQDVRRIVQLHQRTRREIVRLLEKRNTRGGGDPLVTVEMVPPILARGSRTIVLRVPSSYDSASARLHAEDCRFPKFETVQRQVPWQPGIVGACGLNLGAMQRIQRFLQGTTNPTGGLVYNDGKANVWPGDDADYVLLMPVSMPREDQRWIFGQPEALAETAQPALETAGTPS